MGARRAAGLVLVGALALGACAADEVGTPRFESVGNAVPAEGGWDCPEGSCDWSPAGRAGASKADGALRTEEAGESLASTAPAPSAGGVAVDDVAPPTTTATPASSAVSAGSVDDNELWEEYLRYREEAARLGVDVRTLDVEGRQILRVVDGAGRPVLGAQVVVTDQSGATAADLRTYADGRTLFFPSTEVDPSSQSRPHYTATARLGDVAAEVDLTPEQRDYTLTLDGELPARPAQLDVLFLVDATGSMGDEIDRLKAHIDSVAEQIDALPVRPDVRFGMTVYRDRGDLFVTRTFDFTGDEAAFAAALAEVQADGGGDTPEDLEAGLDAAVTGASWRGDDTVKLVFLVADAPPHLDYDGTPYTTSLERARAAGIKIHPVAASGLDAQGEYVFRQLAQATTGRFVFLTYGADGASPGDSTPHHVDRDDYSVLPLDELVVRLVTEELAHQSS